MTFNKNESFDLPLLPPQIDSKSDRVQSLLIEARVALAELKGFSFSLPNPLLLLSPAILRESVASSEIENIHTTIVEVLQNQLFPERERRERDKEVLRYRDAIILGFNKLRKFPISTRTIIDVQEKLIPTSSGEYRQIQNAIENVQSKKRLYTPPLKTEIPRLMGNWEIFINNDDSLDPLIKAAISHYQFEAIHPFKDGNGRTGRMLIVLYLAQSGILKWPILYISGYLNKNRSEYYNRLLAVTKKQDWEGFICFMLKGFYSQAKETTKVLFKIMALFEQYKSKIKKNHKNIYSADLVEAIFSYPIITQSKLSDEIGIHYTTARRHLKELAKAGILENKRVGKYNLFINNSLLRVMGKG